MSALVLPAASAGCASRQVCRRSRLSSGSSRWRSPARRRRWRLAKNTASARGGSAPVHDDELLVVERERRLAADDVEREPGARLVAFVEVVVHQPRVARERDALARRREVGLGHHAVLVVAQLVGGGGEQVDQHLVVVGLARAAQPGTRSAIATISVWRNES